MPLRKVCVAAGIRDLAVTGRANGVVHAAAPLSEQQMRRTKVAANRASSLYSSCAWKESSRAYLVANPFCVRCEEESRLVLADCVEHLVPHCGHKSLFWDRSNWQPLCQSCRDKRIVKEHFDSAG